MAEAAKVSEPILDRDDDNRSRRQRMAKMKKGGGVFVYEGGHEIVLQEPTVKFIDRQTPVIDDKGFPVLDVAGRQVYESANKIERDHEGKPMLGGRPKTQRVEVDPLVVRGVEFPKGKPVHVKEYALALKLRCLGSLRELDDAAYPDMAVAGGDEPVSGRERKRRRKVSEE